MTDNKSGERESASLLRVMTAQYHTLVAAGASQSLLREYAAVLRFLRLNRDIVFKDVAHTAGHRERPSGIPFVSDEQLRNASLSEVEKLVNRTGITRREL